MTLGDDVVVERGTSDYFYRVYGLSVKTNRSLEFLPPAPELSPAPDVVVEFVGDQPVQPKARVGNRLVQSWSTELPDGGFHRFVFLGQAYFEFVIQPTSIRVAWSPEIPFQDLVHYVLGTGFVLLLRRNGNLCLHGSAIAINDRAIILCGKKGMGKSTLSVEMIKAGFPGIADDLAAITEEDGVFRVQPGYPQFRLRPEVATQFETSGSALPIMLNGNYPAPLNKHYLDLLTHNLPFCNRPMPIAAVYILAARQPITQPEIDEVDGLGKLQLLRANIPLPLMPFAKMTSLLTLANRVRIRRVIRPDGLHQLEQTRRAIIDDVFRL